MTFGVGDLVSIGAALVFLLVGVIRPQNRTRERMALFLANGLSFGTMAMVLVSPAFQVAGAKANLLEIAFKDGKLTLWWAAAVAAANLIRALL